MRLFVAVHPPESALDDLAAVVERLRIGAATAGGATVGVIPRERWHMTLAFLGEVPEERVGAAAEALAAGVKQWRALGEPPPHLWIAGSGRFGRGRATVIWAGVDGEVTGLRSLHSHVRRALRRARLPYDRRPLKPHLTLARPGTRLPEVDLAADLARLDRYRGPEWRLGEVYLMRSRPGPSPVYEQLAVVPLTPLPDRPSD